MKSRYLSKIFFVNIKKKLKTFDLFKLRMKCTYSVYHHFNDKMGLYKLFLVNKCEDNRGGGKKVVQCTGLQMQSSHKSEWMSELLSSAKHNPNIFWVPTN